jgi:uncharacterized protein
MFLNLKAGLNALCLMLMLSLSMVSGMLYTQQARAELVAVPPLEALVTDLTGTLNSSEIAQLDAKLKAFESEKGSQVAVLIVPTTQPEDIAQYSIRVVEEWKLGRKKQDDGVLILVAKNDRKMRIEVGRGLEGAIPDLYAKRIVDEELKPHFKQGDFYGGINAATDKVTGLITGENLEAPTTGNYGSANGLSIGSMWPFYLIGILFLGSILTGILGRFFGSTATAGIVGGTTALLATMPMGLFAGIIAFILSMFWFSSGVSNGRSARSSGGGWIGGGVGGGWSSGGSSWGGGGGGDFGGGGASGDW